MEGLLRRSPGLRISPHLWRSQYNIHRRQCSIPFSLYHLFHTHWFWGIQLLVHNRLVIPQWSHDHSCEDGLLVVSMSRSRVWCCFYPDVPGGAGCSERPFVLATISLSASPDSSLPSEPPVLVHTCHLSCECSPKIWNPSSFIFQRVKSLFRACIIWPKLLQQLPK